jgi:hypothetical protein
MLSQTYFKSHCRESLDDILRTVYLACRRLIVETEPRQTLATFFFEGLCDRYKVAVCAGVGTCFGVPAIVGLVGRRQDVFKRACWSLQGYDISFGSSELSYTSSGKPVWSLSIISCPDN